MVGHIPVRPMCSNSLSPCTPLRSGAWRTCANAYCIDALSLQNERFTHCRDQRFLALEAVMNDAERYPGLLCHRPYRHRTDTALFRNRQGGLDQLCAAFVRREPVQHPMIVERK